jgi:hypothetical protein
VLKEHPSQDLDNGVGDIGVVIRATHVSTFSGQVVAIADLVLLCPSVVFTKRFGGRLWVVRINTVPVFIHWDKFLRFDAR